MAKNFLISILFLFFYVQNVSAQDTQEKTLKNYIGIQVTQIYFGEYQLNYERMLTKRISLELIGSKQPIKNSFEVREPGFYGSSYLYKWNISL